jgi:TPR repeat protein
MKYSIFSIMLAVLSNHALANTDNLNYIDYEKTAWILKVDSQNGENHYDLAYKYALASANLGSKNAMLWLGELIQGQHVSSLNLSASESVKKAIFWWEKAALAGESRGYTDIALLYLHKEIPGGSDNFSSIDKDDLKAEELLLKAVNLGDTKAPRYLGLEYQNSNKHIKKDIVKAINYFKIAKDRGDSTASMIYADYLVSGKYIPQDINQAIDIYKTIIESNGHDKILCSYKLGVIYLNGKLIAKNKSEAMRHLKVSANGGNKEALDLLKHI